MMDNKNDLNRIISLYIKENPEVRTEIDWWHYIGNKAYNVHNYRSDDGKAFKIDEYDFDVLRDEFDYTKWETLKEFNIEDYMTNKKPRERTYKEIERLTIWADGIIQGIKMMNEVNGQKLIDEFFYFNDYSSVLNIVLDKGVFTATVFDREDSQDRALDYSNGLELKVRQ